jgi:dolichol-phosphate mannosyltransferase
MHTISVVIPFLNEEDNVPNLLQQLSAYATEVFAQFKLEVIFVDDGSTDNSVEKLKKGAAKNINPKIISLSKNFGSHAAIRAGILHCTGDFIVFMYADLQDPIELIGKMYALIQQNNDIVWAERETTESSFFEGMFSKAYATLMQRYVAAGFPDRGFDIVMFSRKIQDQMNRNIESNSSVFLQLFTMGFKQQKITYSKVARKAGKSKWTISKKVKLFIDSFIAFSYAPVRFVTITGIIMFTVGLLWTFYIVLRQTIYGDLNPGWPALVSILVLGFGITNISLGIIAEYLWRTLDTSRKRPVFIIEDIINLADKP